MPVGIKDLCIGEGEGNGVPALQLKGANPPLEQCIVGSGGRCRGV